jgi:hypothetical protein
MAASSELDVSKLLILLRQQMRASENIAGSSADMFACSGCGSCLHGCYQRWRDWCCVDCSKDPPAPVEDDGIPNDDEEVPLFLKYVCYEKVSLVRCGLGLDVPCFAFSGVI